VESNRCARGRAHRSANASSYSQPASARVRSSKLYAPDSPGRIWRACTSLAGTRGVCAKMGRVVESREMVRKRLAARTRSGVLQCCPHGSTGPRIARNDADHPRSFASGHATTRVGARRPSPASAHHEDPRNRASGSVVASRHLVDRRRPRHVFDLLARHHRLATSSRRRRRLRGTYSRRCRSNSRQNERRVAIPTASARFTFPFGPDEPIVHDNVWPDKPTKRTGQSSVG